MVVLLPTSSASANHLPQLPMTSDQLPVAEDILPFSRLHKVTTNAAASTYEKLIPGGWWVVEGV